MSAPFAQLVVRTPWSLQRGAAPVEALAAAAARRRIHTVGIVDTGTLAGALDAWRACADAGARPLLGVELDDGDTAVVLLVRDRVGYRSLCRATNGVQLADGGSAPGDASLADRLAERSRGLFVLARDVRTVDRLAGRVPGRRLRLALAPCPGMDALAGEVARRHGIAAVAVGDVTMAGPADGARARLLRAIGLRTTVDRVPPPGRAIGAGGTPWLAGEREVRRRFAAWPSAVDEAAALAAACRFDLPRDLGFGRARFPRPPAASDGAPAHRRLARRCERGLVARIGARAGDRHRRRLRRELRVIGELGYAPYFLVLADLVALCRERGIAHRGRGSAAGSMVAWVLGLSPVDPLAHDLLFERFLNRSRRDPPDVDLDVDWRQRDAVAAALADRHGAGQVAAVGTHVRYGARGSLRAAGRAFGVPETALGRLTRAWPAGATTLAPDALAEAGGVAGLRLDRAPWPQVIAGARAIERLPRGRALHPTGLVVSPRPLRDEVPLFRSARGPVATEWTGDGLARVGLVKLDLIASRGLAVVASVERSLEPPPADEVDLAADPAACALLERGQTLGCFHVESPAMRSLLRRMRCRSLDDLIAAAAVVRPGVASSGMLRAFLDRRAGRGREAPALLRALLPATHGVVVYQEDVMRVAQRLAGFELAEADGLRRALVRRGERHRLARYEARFVAGARARGLSSPDAAGLWAQVASFAGYAFCRAHAASFAGLSARAVQLRAHHPARFWAAVLSQRGGFYQPSAYVAECRRSGVEVRPPCVERSGVDAAAEGGAVRLGLGAVGALSAAEAGAVVEARRRDGPFGSAAALWRRVDVRDRAAEALIRCGALDGCGEGRSHAELLWERRGVRTVAPPADSGAARLIGQLETLGLGLDAHPLALWLPIARPRRVAAARVDARRLGELRGATVWLAAWPVARKALTTADGRSMELLSFEDEHALYEAAVFPAAWRRLARRLQRPGPFWVRGRVCDDGGGPTVVVDELRAMEVDGARIDEAGGGAGARRVVAGGAGAGAGGGRAGVSQ